MPDDPLPLAVVDGLELPESIRRALRPGELLEDRASRKRRLPRFFYQVDSWAQARELPLSPRFMMWEFLGVDVREAPPARSFPRYVPCAVTLLAAHLEVLREAVGTYVHVAANGGYRTPAHALTRFASPHCWAAAANVYRIGDELLDTRERIERYAALVRQKLPAVWVRPWGHDDGCADDHLHIDLGHVVSVPRDAGSENG
ncbi:MAG: hypothetical protein ACRELX_07170 [Longimicrobiales bacterium]